MTVFVLNSSKDFPNPEQADDEGLLAIGGDLSSERLINAYKNGIFPWYSEDLPILWWSPNPRCVLFLDKLKISKSLLQIIKKNIFKIKFDTCFDEVITHCATISRKNADESGTWITDDMKKAYITLHELGFAHSVEAFYDNKLVGGLYGVAIGKAFFGESMFYLMSNASKVAFVSLVKRLQEWNFDIIDVQQTSSHMLRFGAEEIRRSVFLYHLRNAVVKEGHYFKWSL